MKRLSLSALILVASTVVNAQSIESTAEETRYYEELGVHVKRLEDSKKDNNTSAAKLTWHEKKGEWQRQIILYNKYANGESLDRQLKYVVELKIPNREGQKKWETVGRKTFK